MKTCKRTLALLLSLVLAAAMVFSIPFTASASEKTTTMTTGQRVEAVYTLKSPIDVMNAEIEITYSENLIFNKITFPGVYNVTYNHKYPERKILISFTNAEAPYAQFTEANGAVMYKISFTAASDGEANVTDNIKFIGGETENNTENPDGIPLVEDNAYQTVNGTAVSGELTLTASDAVCSFNGIATEVGDYVEYVYELNANGANIVDAQLSVPYDGTLLEFISSEFPSIDPVVEIYENIENEDNENAVYYFAMSDIEHPLESFIGGLVKLTFRVKSEGIATAVAIVETINGDDGTSVVEKDTPAEGVVENDFSRVIDSPSFSVTLTPGEGYVLSGDSSVVLNSDYTFTLAASTGYDISNAVVKVNGEVVTAVNGVYTVSGVSEKLTVTVEGVTKQQIAVTLPTNPVGYTVTGATSVAYGDDYTFRVAAATGYDLTNAVVKVNGTAVTGTNGSYTVSGVTAPITITVEGAAKQQLAVTLPANPVGYTVTGATSVAYGDNYTFTVAAAEGYDLTNAVVKVNGTAVTGTNGSYTVNGVTTPISVTVEGAVKQQIAVTLPENPVGYTITGADSVAYGEDYTFTIEAADTYTLADAVVKVGDTVLTPDENGVYTVSSVTAPITITVDGVKLAYRLGDVNNDGDINSTDATLVLQNYGGLSITGTFIDEAADVNGDGDINSTDATLILQFYGNLITVFPAEA